MSKIVEMVKNGQQVTTEELFNTVNGMEITTLMLRTVEDKNTFMAMEINKCEEMDEEYTFSQSCTSYNSSLYTVKKENIVNVTAKYYADSDAFYIECELKNGLEMLLLVVNVSSMESKLSDFREIDVYELQEFIEETLCKKNEYCFLSAKIEDVYGLNLQMFPKDVSMNTLDEAWKLHLGCDTATFDIPVTDDSVNEFYLKDTDDSRKIIVKPYGQPFMEISLLFFKKSK